MTTITPTPEPDDVARGLAQLELYAQPSTPTPAPQALELDGPEAELVPVVSGETKRVQQLRAQVAEAHLLADLQDDDAPLMVDTPRVRKRRLKAREAARLHQLAQDPTMRAYQAARMRRLLVGMSMTSLTLALSWSTAGVQAFAADDAPVWSPAWVFAWLVEPFVSLALLVVVGARAYLATAGRPLDDKKLIRIEWLFLALSLGMNAWPYLPWSVEEFEVSALVLHLLGPAVAVAIVTALPIILSGFTALDHACTGTGGTAPAYRENVRSRTVQSADVEALAVQVRALIEDGQLPENPGVHKIRKALGCGTDTARLIRTVLTDGGVA